MKRKCKNHNAMKVNFYRDGEKHESKSSFILTPNGRKTERRSEKSKTSFSDTKTPSKMLGVFLIFCLTTPSLFIRDIVLSKFSA
ncbi:hypothetical protein AKH11_06815 [Vibrio parahaemolyticus]|nr:hypothetical protein AKH11_06815 [Vibrio parahaemolyticus]OCQ06025.1 hypothetical protein AKH09_14450 [Vibrio parahaemolyticus]ODW52757.1 hypothetical protein BBL86_08490 [Vibrio parahaemolyticus]